MGFGEVLRKIRTKYGDSLRGLGEKTNIYFTYIAKIETGEKVISQEILEKLIEEYPLQKNELIDAYVKELLPDFVLKEIESEKKYNLETIENSPEKELYDILFETLEAKEQKEMLNMLIDRLEILHFKKGTLEKNIKKLEAVKKAINEV